MLLNALPWVVRHVAGYIDEEFLFPGLKPMVSHASGHAVAVYDISHRIGELLGVWKGDERSDHLADCLGSAVLLHDLGNWGGRHSHDQVGVLITWLFLSQTALPIECRKIIAHAVAVHDVAPFYLLDRKIIRPGLLLAEENGPLGLAGQDITSDYYLVSALLFLGDKLHVGRLIPSDKLLMQAAATAFGRGRNIHLAQANLEGVSSINLSYGCLIVKFRTKLKEYMAEVAASLSCKSSLQTLFFRLLPWLDEIPDNLTFTETDAAMERDLCVALDTLFTEWLVEDKPRGRRVAEVVALSQREKHLRNKILILTTLFANFNQRVCEELRQAYGPSWIKCARLLGGFRRYPTPLVIRTDWPSGDIIYSSDPSYN
jgi:hypothetical protein